MGGFHERYYPEGISAKASAAGVAALSLGGLLASCASDNNAASKPEAGTDGATALKNQVVVSMTTGSEPAAGFDPLVSWGWVASMCTSR